MQMKHLLLLASLLTCMGAGAQQATFRNPVIAGDMADPTVIRVDNTYYATGTSSEWAPYHPRILIQLPIQLTGIPATISGKKANFSRLYFPLLQQTSQFREIAPPIDTRHNLQSIFNFCMIMKIIQLILFDRATDIDRIFQSG
jgi:hypothetical protein